MERQPRRRRRPARSCLGCRRRKIKCDRNNPCAHCVSAGIRCVFRVHRDGPVVEIPQAPVPDTPTSAPPQSPQPHRVGTSEPVIGYGSRPTGPVGPEDAGAPGSALGAEQPPTLSHRHDDDNDTLRSNRLGDTEQNTRDAGRSPSGAYRPYGGTNLYQDMLASQPHLEGAPVTPDKEQIVRSGHWGGIAQEVIMCALPRMELVLSLTAVKFTTIMALYTEAIGCHKGPSQDAESKAAVADIASLLQKCKSIAKSMKVGRPGRNLSGPLFGLELPSRAVADEMTSKYFRSYESTYRILHEPTFRAEYERFWIDPQGAPMGIRLKILLAVALGSGLSNTGPTLRSMAHQWVYTAQTWLSGPLEKDRLNIVGLQIHCLTILARQVLSIGADLIWTSVGQLLHSGMQLGLHRDPKHFPSMSAMQSELRRRLWATILELTVQSALDAAMPPRISFDDFDTEPPSNSNDDEIDESTTRVVPHPRNTYTTTCMQLTLLDSLPTRLRIVQLLNSLRSELSYPQVLDFSKHLTEACQAHTAFLDRIQDTEVTPFRRNLLDYLVRRFMLPLHSLFATKARADPLYHYSLRASLDAAMAIMSPGQDEDFRRLMTVGGGPFREGFRCAGTTICIELLAQVDAQKLDGTLHRDSQYRNLLREKVKGLLSFSTDRIQAGETNVKTRMFLNMILAQVEAVERGLDCRPEIAKAAKESLGVCYDLLRTLAGTDSEPDLDDAGLTPRFGGGQEDYWWDSDAQFLFGVDFT